MKVLVIEDEAPAARRLQRLLQEAYPHMEVLQVLDNVEDSIAWLRNYPQPDLIFMDIQLSDNLSFVIFENVEVESPVIFTTAYDEYALRAFKVNSIDYLLKPIEIQDLESSIQKLDRLKTGKLTVTPDLADTLVRNVTQGGNAYKSRFLIKKGEQLISIPVGEAARFIYENKITFLVTWENRKYLLDYPLDELEKMLDPQVFFRLNRQCIAHIDAIQSIHSHFNGKLKVHLKGQNGSDGLMVSREKATTFKEWLNQ